MQHQTPMTAEEKERIFRENRALLEEDLARPDLVFRSRPFKVDLQLSNFCNMSCAMCYNGKNPPLEKMSDRVVQKIAQDLLPTASVVVPFLGSEPLALTWNLARDLAREYHLELEIDTNVQYLDQEKFRELEPHVTTIVLSVDSHVPEIYEQLRLKGNREKVFKNLTIAARLCRQHGIEAIVNIVFLTLNAPSVHQTIAFMADLGIPTVRIIAYRRQALARPGLDALRSLSREQVQEIKLACIRTAREKRIRLLWEVDDCESVDHRVNREFRQGKHHDTQWQSRLQRFLPGYCSQSVNRAAIHANGTVYPCCVAHGKRLIMGNLERQDFEEIWNGPEARDLRRGMLTWDVPKICRQCGFRTPLPPAEEMPFSARVESRLGAAPGPGSLEPCGPTHMAREERPVTFRWKRPDQPVDRYLIGLAPGGEENRMREFLVPADQHEFRIPGEVWEELSANLGHWWTIWGIRDSGPAPPLRAREIRCLIRHRPLARIKESTFRYWR